MKDYSNNTDETLQWPSDCLALAGSFPDFPLRNDKQVVQSNCSLKDEMKKLTL